jgi:serine phosphatase RsbU (regulator of sigma subunit)
MQAGDKKLAEKNTPAKKTKIRRKLILLILPTCIIPLIGLSSFSSLRTYNYLEKQNQTYYTTLLRQVKKNVSFMLDQYNTTFTNIFKLPSVIDGLSRPPYQSMQQEKEISEGIVGGGQTSEGKASMRATVQERIDGTVLLYELGRRSLFNDTDYKVHRAVDPSITVYIPNFEKMVSDPLFKSIQENPDQEFIFGMFKEGVLPTTYSGQDRPIMIFPFARDSSPGTFDTFALVQVNSDFLPEFYSSITEMQYGTLFILDQFNNIINYNHPNPDDYYDYDEEKKRYILGNDDPDDPDELLTFRDYQMLVTDPAILQNARVVEMIENLETGAAQSRMENVFFKGRSYLTIVEYEPVSKTRFVYFHPVQQVQAPILNIIFVLLVITVIVIGIIIVVSIALSRSLTTPIHSLKQVSDLISDGNYSQLADIKTGDELEDLSNNFNTMIRNVKSFQDQLLSVEREKTELDVANRIQTCLLPEVTQTDGYEITACLNPSSVVGGDYYDFIGSNDGERVWLGIGDVSGGGLISGLIIMMAQTAFNTILLNNPKISSEKLIKQVNRVLYQNVSIRLGERNYMTLTFMVIDKKGEVRYAGSHLDILVFRASGGKIERLETHGTWLGVEPELGDKTVEKKTSLEKGDILCLYTDGVITACDKSNTEYGIVRLMNTIEKHHEKPVQEIQEIIMEDLKSYLQQQLDDMTLVMVKKK